MLERKEIRLFEELAVESVEEKEEIISLERFGRFSTSKESKAKALELELEILEMRRGEF